MSETTEKCPHCGSLYKQYMYMVGDQSACPNCVKKAASNMQLTIHKFDNLIDSGSGKPFVIKSYSTCDTYQASQLGKGSGLRVRMSIGGGSRSSNEGVGV